MDPLTAFFNMVAAICNMVAEVNTSLDPETRKANWDRWNKFIDACLDLMGKK